MNVEELIRTLRNNLQPSGTAQVVQLHINSYGMFDVNAVQKAVDRLEYLMTIGVALGEKATPLEALGIRLLLDSIYYDYDAKPSQASAEQPDPSLPPKS